MAASAVLMLASAFVLNSGYAHAATRSVVVPVVVTSDNIHVNSSVSSPDIVSTGVTMPGTNTITTTPLDDASTMGGPNGYTWRLDLSGVCSGAQLQGLRVVTESVTTDEEPTNGIFLGVYGTNDLTMLETYSINGGLGEDSDPWVLPLFGFSSPIIDRGRTGTFGPLTTFPADLGMAGVLDVTWDISGINPEEPLGIYIQHWLYGDVTTAQTTIQSVTLTYDDANCTNSNNAGTQDSSSNTNSDAQLASTGQNSVVLALVALTITMVSITILSHRLKY